MLVALLALFSIFSTVHSCNLSICQYECYARGCSSTTCTGGCECKCYNCNPSSVIWTLSGLGVCGKNIEAVKVDAKWKFIY